MNKPTVSILLPTYNGARSIARAIDSVWTQTYKDWELIVVDDGSSDETSALVRSFAQEDERIIYVRNDANLGIQRSLNRGLAIARGDYIARIDDDDSWIDKAKLASQVEYLEAHPDVVLVGTAAVVVDMEGHRLYQYEVPQSDVSIRRAILSKNPFVHPSVLFSKEAARKAGGYSEERAAKHVEDHDLWLRLGARGHLANLPSHSVALTAHPDSLSAKNRTAQFRRILMLVWRYRNTYPRVIPAFVVGTVRLVLFRFFKFFPKWFRTAFMRTYKRLG